MLSKIRIATWTIAFFLHALPALAQTPANEQAALSANVGKGAREGRRLANYLLGPGDEITIMSVYAPEIAKQPVRITTSGDINLVMLGRFHAAGQTVEQLEADVRERLKAYVKEPDVAISLTQLRSQPVSVLGTVGSPGVVQLEGVKTLIEVLSMAGGIRAEAGSRVKITRGLEWGTIPLPSAKLDGEYTTAEVNLRSIENATSPEENIQILPYDVISVPRAEVIYVIGEGVRTPGAFTLSDRGGISVIEALAKAQGTAPAADVKGAKIIHPGHGSNRVEVPLNLKDVLNGKAKDVMLQADDIVYIPRSELKGSARRSLETIVQLATGAIIYRGF